MALKGIIFQYHMKHGFINLLVHILSLGDIRVYIIYIGTIAGWKSTGGYITLCQITSITFNYFNSYVGCYWYLVMQKQSSQNFVITLVKVRTVPYLNGCIGSSEVGKSQLCFNYILGPLEICCCLLGNFLQSDNPFNLVVRFSLN